MKYVVLIAAGLILGPASQGIAAAAASSVTKAPFGCDARGSAVCHFQIFYPNGRGRVVVLPAGMKVTIPDLRVGSDSYCVALNMKPAHKCPRKTINANYNN